MFKERGLVNPLFSQFPQMDKVANRKRVLAKVYGLLIRLADEMDEPTIVLDIVGDENEKIMEASPVQLELL